MGFQFATCERSRALGFLQKVYPSRTIADTDDSAGPLLDLVEKDVVRIQDPMMHGNRIQVVPGTKWVEDKETRDTITGVCAKLHSGG